jgi:effector-binding domain-containing protein
MEEIAIVEVPSRQVIGIQKTGTYRIIPDLILKLYEYSIEKGIAIAGMPTFLCHETSPDAVREANEKGTAVVEVAWPVSGTVEGSGDIRAYKLPGGKMVRTRHLGPYETCELTYRRLFSWMTEHHLTIAGPIRESYPNNPHEVRPEEIITEILVPVR